MINLLPYERKAEIRAGRFNVILANYILLSLIALLLVGGIVVFAYISLNMTRATARTRVDENTTKIASYSKIRTEADSFRKDLLVAKQILDKQVAYSTLLLEFAKYVPPGVVIDTLPVDQKTLDTPIVILAHASNRNTALEFKSKLEAQTALFSNVQFTTFAFETQPSDPAHPVAITMSVTIKKAALQQ